MATVFTHWLLAAVVNILHPFYVSVTELNYNNADKNMEISCKLFIDDFEKALAKQYKTPVDLTRPKNKAQTEKMILAYLQDHLRVKTDDKELPLQWVGYEKEGEAAWCYLQIVNLSQPKKVQLQSNMLYELFDTQANIVHVTVAGKRKSAKLSAPGTDLSFSFP